MAESFGESIVKIQDKREESVDSLTKSLEHFDLKRVIYIITSFMNIEDLEKLAKFQAERDLD